GRGMVDGAAWSMHSGPAPARGRWNDVLDHPSAVIRALSAYMDVFDPRTGSLLIVGRSAGHVESEPVRGLSARIEERAELVSRLQRLDLRKRNVLCLWYMTGLSAVEIARRVGVSRVHAYRLR